MSNAYDELEILLKHGGFTTQKVVILPPDLWCRLQEEIRFDPFLDNLPHPAGVLWYKGRTMLFPKESCLDLSETKSENTA